jgi:hypothetical protein
MTLTAAEAATQLGVSIESFSASLSRLGFNYTTFTECDIANIAGEIYSHEGETYMDEESDEDFHHPLTKVDHYASPTMRYMTARLDMELESNIDMVKTKLDAYRNLEPESSMIPQIEEELAILIARRQ